MKNLIISLTVILLSFTSLEAQELSKQEKKALKVEIKAMKKSPEKLMRLKQKIELSENLVVEQTEIIAGLNKEAQIAALNLSEINNELESTKADLAKSTSIMNNLSNSGSSNAPMNHSGEKYRVQIGLYKNIDLSHLFDKPNFMVHEDINGEHRYSIGNFNSEEEAETFKVEMMKFGISGAFVSTYTDGLRTDNLTPGQN